MVKDFSADPETVIANIYGGDLDGDGELKNFMQNSCSADSPSRFTPVGFVRE